MKFVTDKINTGKGKSFDDLIKDFISKKEVKTASANVQTKKANLDNFGDKKAEPFGAKKDDKEVELVGTKNLLKHLVGKKVRVVVELVE